MAAGCGAGHTGAPAPAPASGTTATTTPTSAATGFISDATIEVGFPDAPLTWDPLAAPGPSPALQAVAAAVLPSAFDVDQAGLPVQQTTLVASARSVGVAPQVVTYTVDPRAVWSDGTPVSGADFVATWRAAAAEIRAGGAVPASLAGYDRIASVRTDRQDPDRVTVTFARTDPDWRSLFSPLLPARVLDRRGRSVWSDPVTSLLSAGPFVVTSSVPGAEVTLARNPRWWGPAANLAAVTVRLGVTAQVAAASLLQGSLDAALLPDDPTVVRDLAATDGLAAAPTDAGGYDDLRFDARRPSLAGAALRLAVAQGIDRAALAASARATGLATAPVDDRIGLAATLGSAPTRRGRPSPAPDDATALPSASPAVRLQDLAAAGFREVDGQLRRHGTPVRLTLLVATASPEADLEAAAVRAACQAIGVALTTSTATPAAAQRAVDAGRYDLALVGTQVATFALPFAAAYTGGGTGDGSSPSAPAADALAGRIDRLPLGAARAGAVTALDRLAWSDAFDIPLLSVPVVLAGQSRYANLTPAPGPAGVAAGIAVWGIPQHT